MQDFANLTAELIAGRRGEAVQMENVRLGVKMERPDYFEGGKHHVKFLLRLLSNDEVAAPPQPLMSGIAWMARRYRLLLRNNSVAASQLSH